MCLKLQCPAEDVHVFLALSQSKLQPRHSAAAPTSLHRPGHGDFAGGQVATAVTTVSVRLFTLIF
jgi:hypothetical protein